MLKIAVIGAPETVSGFKALGLLTRPVNGAEEARSAFRELTRDREDVAIIYLEEALAEPLKNEIDKYKDDPMPAVILIPGREGSKGLGLQALNEAVERAVGTNIL